MENLRKEISRSEAIDLMKEYCELLEIEGDFSDLFTLDVYSYEDEKSFPGLEYYIDSKKIVNEMSSKDEVNDKLNLLIVSELNPLLRNILRLELKLKLEIKDIDKTLDLFYFILGQNEFTDRLYCSVYIKLVKNYLMKYYCSENEDIIEIINNYPCKLRYGMIDNQVDYFLNKTFESILIDFEYSFKVLLVKYKENVYNILKKALCRSEGLKEVNNMKEYLSTLAEYKIHFSITDCPSVQIKGETDIVRNLRPIVYKGVETLYYEKLK